MPGISSSSNLVELLAQLERQWKKQQQASEAAAEALLKQQSQQAELAASINKTLAQVSGLLSALVGGGVVSAARPAVASVAAFRPVAPAAKPARRSKARKFAVSGIESVLTFVKAKGNPTSAEINANWKHEGRGGKADNTLGLLVRERQLKRVPNKDGRGSRYSAL